MNATNQRARKDKLDSSASAIGRIPSRKFDLTGCPTAADREPVEVSYCPEEFTRLLDEHQIAWRYKHRTFAVEWDEEGNFVDCFAPDFYMPAFDFYVELAATGRRALAETARKVRLLRREHPEIRIELLSAASPSSVLEMFH